MTLSSLLLLSLAITGAISLPQASTPDEASSGSAAPSASSASDASSPTADAAAAPTPVDNPGGIPYSVTSAFVQPSATSQALTPTPTANGSAEVAALWELVEQYIPVETAAVTSVISVPKNYSFGADPPPYNPDYLVATTKDLKLPKNFIWGTASAATQVEGATKTDGKGPSSWDYLCHIYPSECNGYTADVTVNQYYMYKLDIARLKHLGINAYSFSIAWTRIYPLGSGQVNEAGLKYYEALVKECLDNGIEPIITLFHWDAPLALVRNYGGFVDIGDTFVEDYARYATTVFKRLGKKVKHWVTFNEPRVFCAWYAGLPYNTSYPEGINSTAAPFQCTYNTLRAHGHAVKSYRQLVKSGEISPGMITFKSDDNWPYPNRAGNADDLRSAQRHADFNIGIFAQPVYGNGDYPESVKKTVGSMLPALSEEDKKVIKGSGDYFPIDGYRTDISRAALNGIDNCAKNISDPNWPICEEGASRYSKAFESGWPIGQPADPGSGWLVNTASGLRRQFKYLAKNYPNKGGFILSEFGFAEPFEYLRTDLWAIRWDGARTKYMQDYLNQLLLSIHEDGINIIGTLAWSLVDNFEWHAGLQQKFGIQHVNFSDPNLARTFKLSSYAVRDFGKLHLQD